MNNYIDTLIADNKRHTGSLVFATVMHTATFVILSVVFWHAYQIEYFGSDSNLIITALLYTVATVVTQSMWASITGDELHKRRENLKELAYYANKGMEARRKGV